jgi:hypothetical protein
VRPLRIWLRAHLTRTRRAWLYRVVTAGGIVALVFGLATGEQVASVVGLAGALLGTGVAAANTPTDPATYKPPTDQGLPPSPWR